TIEDIYQQVLNRHADDVGLAGWSNFLALGHTFMDLRIALVDSAEYSQTHVSDADFLTGLYRTALHRDLDTTGALAWSLALTTGTTRSAVAQEVFNSNEAQSSAIEAYYSQYLHRQGEDSGLNGFLGALQHGMTLDQVATNMIGSTEYFSVGK